jgi:hypothetical protein
MNSMRGRYSTYEKYANLSFDDMFSGKQLADAYTAKSEQLASCYLENTGGGKFSIRALPMEAQVSPVYGIISEDINGDGNLDVLLAGNSYETEISTGWYDASIGLYLEGNGKGQFRPVSVQESGFFADKDSKGMASVQLKNNEQLIIVANNNDHTKAFTRNNLSTATALTLPVKLLPSDAWAEIHYKNGQKQKQELTYSSVYLSQKSRRLQVSANVDFVTIYDYNGKSRKVQF